MKHLELTYSQAIISLKKQIENCSIGISIDIWRSRARRNFFGVVLTTIDSNWEILCIPLALKIFDISHTSNNIEILMNSIFNDFEISKDRISGICHDNGANISKAVKDFISSQQRNV